MSWVAVITGGAALVGGAMSADAAGDASDAQVQSSAEAIAEQRRQFDLVRGDTAPYRKTGTEANERLRALLDGKGRSDLLRTFDRRDLNTDPVYRSGLDFGRREGRNAINARAIAGGGYDSGATLKALTRFGNDYASTKANESFNRYNTNRSSIYNMLAGVSGTGQVANSQTQAAGTNMANNVSGMLTDAGNSRAASIVGGANAWSNAFGGVNKAYGNYQSQQNYTRLSPRGGGGGGDFDP